MPLRSQLSDAVSLQNLIEASGVRTSNTRVDRYIKYLQALLDGENERANRVFSSRTVITAEDGAALFLDVLREIHELNWIFTGFPDCKNTGVINKLKSIVGGTDFAIGEKTFASRNAQFELRIASYFSRAGYSLDMETETDIIATKGKFTYFVECKRIQSLKKLLPRIKEARQQLSKRLPTANKATFGVAAIELTKASYPDLNTVVASTPDHSRDILKDRLKSLAGELPLVNEVDATPDYFLTWLQLHMHCRIKYPDTVMTRLSNYLRLNVPCKGRAKKALRQFMRITNEDALDDPRIIFPDALSIRQKVGLPKDSIISFDKELLGAAARLDVLPYRHPEFIVGSARFQDQDYEFTFSELNGVYQALTNEWKEAIRGNLWAAVPVLLSLMIFWRDPYEDPAASE